MSKILVTAGSTSVPIDQVRTISNRFRGRTGHGIAEAAAAAGHEVTLLTSGAEEAFAHQVPRLRMERYQMFDELHALMAREIPNGGYDVIIHSAAVSDYRVAAVRSGSEVLGSAETGAKIGSSHTRLILELEPTQKLIDLIRSPWGFAGTLVKFKLEVGKTDEELQEIARRSRATSDADLIVANCFEWSPDYAYVIDKAGGCERVTRTELPTALLRRFT